MAAGHLGIRTIDNYTPFLPSSSIITSDERKKNPPSRHYFGKANGME
jgi:hypothetical protein